MDDRPDTSTRAVSYSEDPTIERFVPHVPVTNVASPAFVWAIEARYAPLYWFPRACPRVTVWANDAAQRTRLAEQFGTDRERVQFAPIRERELLRRCQLFEYAFAPGPFAAWPEAEGQWVSSTAVVARRVTPVGELEARQHAAGVDLRWTGDLDAARQAVRTSGLPFSICRYRNYERQP